MLPTMYLQLESSIKKYHPVILECYFKLDLTTFQIKSTEFLQSNVLMFSLYIRYIFVFAKYTN